MLLIFIFNVILFDLFIIYAHHLMKTLEFFLQNNIIGKQE